MAKKVKKLQIGCIAEKEKGSIGLDIAKASKNVDVVHDLQVTPLPFKDEEFGEILIGYYLASIKDLCKFFNELSRILKKDGLVKIAVPYYASARAYQDPTHVHHFTEYSFAFYDKKWRKANGFMHYPLECDFEVIAVNHGLAATEKGKSQDALAFAMLHQWNIVHDMFVTMRKR